MIKYIVTGSTVIYKNADNVGIHTWREEFIDENPVKSRQNAIRFYTDCLTEAKEDGKIIDDQSIEEPTGIDAIFERSHDVDMGVYLEVIDPYDKRWDSLDLEHLFKFGLGTELENFLESNAGPGFKFEDDDFRAVILVPGASYVHMDWFVYALEGELKIYDHFGFDKNIFETTIPIYDTKHKQLVERRILYVPFNWNGYNQHSLVDETIKPVDDKEKQIEYYVDKISNGEGKQVEFKSTLCYDLKEKQPREHIKLSIARTLAAFLNTEGGLLFIGVDDNGIILGLQNDYKVITGDNKRDGFLRRLNNIIRDYIGKEHHHNFADPKFLTHDSKDFVVVKVQKSIVPVILTDKTSNKKILCVRGVADTEELNIEEAINWVFNRFKDSHK